jgi:hypothetical protein
VDWNYAPESNIEWTWDLNRHVFFETLGRAYHYTNKERYACKFGELLKSWLKNNHANEKNRNWSNVYEVALRINTWIWAYYFFRQSYTFDVATCILFLKGLLAQGIYLSKNIEYHVRNNHLLLEAKSLALLGILFPEFKRASKWKSKGLKILFRQIRRQVCSDGVHGERATHYHRVITGELLELFVLMQNNNAYIPEDIIEAFRKMVEFEVSVTKPNGLVPLFGDSSQDDTHLRFSGANGGPIYLNQIKLNPVLSYPEETCIWLLGCERVKKFINLTPKKFDIDSKAFPHGGYFIMRSGEGLDVKYLAFDCGPFGYKPTPNHGHADALSFEMYAFGKTIIVDPGIYSVSFGEKWRNYFRSTKAHNTVVVDDKNQSTLLGFNRVYNPATATLHEWITNTIFDFVDGSHDGYQRLKDPVTHRRQIIFIKPDYWLIIDILKGKKKHIFEQYFHFTPETELNLNKKSGILMAKHSQNVFMKIMPINTMGLKSEVIEGSTSPIQGWVSYLSGKKQPAPVLSYKFENLKKAQFCTVLYPHNTKIENSIKVSSLEIKNRNENCKNGDELTAVQIDIGHYIDYILIDRNPSQTIKTFYDYITDASITYLRITKNMEPVKAIISNGSRLSHKGNDLIKAKKLNYEVY